MAHWDTHQDFNRILAAQIQDLWHHGLRNKLHRQVLWYSMVRDIELDVPQGPTKMRVLRAEQHYDHSLRQRFAGDLSVPKFKFWAHVRLVRSKRTGKFCGLLGAHPSPLSSEGR